MQTITYDAVEKLDHCYKDDFEEKFGQFRGRSATVLEFLDIEEISIPDRIWAALHFVGHKTQVYFACKCARRAQTADSDARSIAAIDAAEAFVEGRISREELEEVVEAAWAAWAAWAARAAAEAAWTARAAAAWTARAAARAEAAAWTARAAAAAWTARAAARAAWTARAAWAEAADWAAARVARADEQKAQLEILKDLIKEHEC